MYSNKPFDGHVFMSSDQLYQLGAHWRQAQRLEQSVMAVCEEINDLTMPPVMLEEIQPWLVLLTTISEQATQFRETVGPLIGPDSQFGSQQQGEDNGI